MSEEHFHVHGPHDHELEHAATHSSDRMAGQLAVMTAILATMGSLFSYMGGTTEAHAALAKNDAAIRKTEESDTWNYYQAKNMKLMLSELALEVVPAERRPPYEKEIARYKTEKAPIMEKAKRLAEESKAFEHKSEALMHEHHRWAQATTALQISIALAAIALLTRRRWLEWGVMSIASIGLVTGLCAFLKI